MIFNPSDVGWHLGRAQEPRGGELWVPWDRTTGVIGPQGSGKTLDLLIPALLSASGAALVTLTKVDDLLLSFPVRSRDGRPCLVLDPFGLAGGLPELVWDPIAGCVDPMVAERRADGMICKVHRVIADRAGVVDAVVGLVRSHVDAAAVVPGEQVDDVLRGRRVLPPVEAGAGGTGVAVMIVVPRRAHGEDAHRPQIGGRVIGIELPMIEDARLDAVDKRIDRE